MLVKLSILSALMAVAAAAPPADNTKTAIMTRLMKMKLDHRVSERLAGTYASGRYTSSIRASNGTSAVVPCVNGKAGEYSCSGVDMHFFLSHESMQSQSKEGNDIWGWTSPEGREFAAVGETDGTAFVEVLADGALKYLGRLDTQTDVSVWRDMKVIDGFVYIGSEAKGHGLQVFDMRKLLTITTPRKFVQKDLTSWYQGFSNSHNIVANEKTKYIYAVGSNTCRGGLHILNVADPANIKAEGCHSEDGYVHDAQCVIYTGPDSRYSNKEICFNFNEDTLTIVDITLKSTGSSPVGTILSRTPYTGSAYTHQGWLIDTTSMSYLLSDDELDEQDQTVTGASGHTVTYLWDIRSLTAPKLTGNYKSPAKSIDHNQYTLNGWTYQSNYGSGLRVVDVSTAVKNGSPKEFKQEAFFDCFPSDDEQGGVVEFDGSWSVYPYFKSGYILLNSIERGVFSLKLSGEALHKRRAMDVEMGV